MAYLPLLYLEVMAMKYTIEGFNQAKAVELGLCVADLIILRWFVDFAGTEKMVKRIIDGKEYYWIKYEGLLEDLPMLLLLRGESVGSQICSYLIMMITDMQRLTGRALIV